MQIYTLDYRNLADARQPLSLPSLQCITPLLKCDGWSITTVEGVGTPDNLDEVQSRLVSNNGTQCGFCTPGFVMSMHR